MIISWWKDTLGSFPDWFFFDLEEEEEEASGDVADRDLRYTVRTDRIGWWYTRSVPMPAIKPIITLNHTKYGNGRVTSEGVTYSIGFNRLSPVDTPKLSIKERVTNDIQYGVLPSQLWNSLYIIQGVLDRNLGGRWCVTDCTVLQTILHTMETPQHLQNSLVIKKGDIRGFWYLSFTV